MGINRSAFLVDESSALQGVWYGVSPGATVPNVVELLRG